ncbi:MAG: hypothetical protein ACYDA8_20650, partial [Deferrisomatales bacterium]
GRGLAHHPHTFGDLTDHVLHPAPVARRVDGRRVTHKEAAAAFLAALGECLGEDLGRRPAAVLLCPGGHREAFGRWLRASGAAEGLALTLVDEEAALAVGHGLDPWVPEPTLVFDFGFSSIRARVVEFRPGADAAPAVRGVAVVPVGTADLARRAAAPEPGCPPGPAGDDDLEARLDPGEVARLVDQAVDQVLADARLSGVAEGDLGRVLLLGRGGRLAAAREALTRRFGDRVVAGRPEAAAGRGALSFALGELDGATVRETWALQTRDPATGGYRYPVVVEPRTRCPSPGPTATYVINTFYDGQEQLELQVCRAPGRSREPGRQEAVFDAAGRVALVSVEPEA